MSKSNKSQKPRVFDPSDWKNIFRLSRFCEVTVNHPHSRPQPWPHFGAPEHYYDQVINTVAPILIATGFFSKTEFKSFVLIEAIVSGWDRDTTVKFSKNKGDLWAKRPIHFEDFGYMSIEEYCQFEIGISAKAILSACQKFGLDSAPVEKLVAEYPLTPIEMCPITFEPSIQLVAPENDRLEIPLSNVELAFQSPRDRYDWCVTPPFTDKALGKIGPDRLNVFVPVSLPVDEFVQIANAMLRAPNA